VLAIYNANSLFLIYHFLHRSHQQIIPTSRLFLTQA